MAARIRKTLHDAETRQRIQTSLIVRRLTDAFEGKLELDATQVSIGIALLRKTLPDLSQVEEHSTVIQTTIATTPLTPAEWAAKHGDGPGMAQNDVHSTEGHPTTGTVQ